MVFERFIKEYYHDFEQQLLEWKKASGISVMAAIRMYEFTKEDRYAKVVCSWQHWTETCSLHEAGEDWTVYGNLLILCREQMQPGELVERLAPMVPDTIETAPYWKNAFYFAWTFWFQYETELNRRKRYGELVKWVKEVAGNQKEWDLVSHSFYMAALADCYEIMTEEAYDQRESIAELLRDAVKWKNVHAYGKDNCLSLAMTAYAMAKGIKNNVLSAERHQEYVEAAMLTIESDYMKYQNGLVCCLTEQEEYNLIGFTPAACALVYSEWLALRKGEILHEG